MKKELILLFLLFSNILAKDKWFDGNLKGIDDLNLEIKLKGVADLTWEKRIAQILELRLLKYNIKIEDEQIPILRVDIQIIDSRVDEISSFLVIFSVYDFSISAEGYSKPKGKILLPKKVMTSKIYSHEILGQSTSQNLYGDVERAIHQESKNFIEQMMRDNPLTQF